jgi:hypothetical protein
MTQAFADIDEKKPTGTGKFKKILYMDTSEGTHILRILDNTATKFYVHYMGFSYVKCLGEECPICETNRKLMYTNPENFRDDKLWKARMARFYVNVLDKTKAKVCHNCGTETKNVQQTVCSSCQTVLGEPEVLNKIKVLAKGPSLFENINMLADTVRSDNDEIYPITAYDWVLVVKGEKKDTVSTISPKFVETKQNVDLDGLELFDLENAVLSLTREEMLDVLNGTSLKDIFAVRRATKLADTETRPDEVLMSDVVNSVRDIFKDL